MPTYPYRCPGCGHEYDKLQKISDTTRAKCPECGTRGERQITGGAGIVFKGSGFYITDYKRAGEEKDRRDKEEGRAPSKSDDKKPKPKSKTGADS
jgi:putative FmdB family regulatory protein